MSPEVVARRRASSSSKGSYELPGYLPPVENSTIMDQRLINKLKGGDSDTAEERAEAMNATFPFRRRQVVKERLSVRKMKKVYPHLFTMEQVSTMY